MTKFKLKNLRVSCDLCIWHLTNFKVYTTYLAIGISINVFIELTDENDFVNKTSIKEVAPFDETKENLGEGTSMIKSEFKNEEEEMQMNEEYSDFNSSDYDEDNSDLSSEIKIEEFYMSD